VLITDLLAYAVGHGYRCLTEFSSNRRAAFDLERGD
jgi:hypothetical protein